MKIYGSTLYIDKEKEEGDWYQLHVISQWDWGTKSVCFKNLNGTIISYCLRDKNYKLVETLTDEMKEVLIGMGCIIK